MDFPDGIYIGKEFSGEVGADECDIGVVLVIRRCNKAAFRDVHVCGLPRNSGGSTHDVGVVFHDDVTNAGFGLC